jgi:hypothetical protein
MQVKTCPSASKDEDHLFTVCVLAAQPTTSSSALGELALSRSYFCASPWMLSNSKTAEKETIDVDTTVWSSTEADA